MRGALRLDHITAAQVIGRDYTAPVKKGAKYKVNLVYEDYPSYYLTLYYPSTVASIQLYGTNLYYLTTLLLQVVLTERSYIVPQVRILVRPTIAYIHEDRQHLRSTR